MAGTGLGITIVTFFLPPDFPLYAKVFLCLMLATIGSLAVLWRRWITHTIAMVSIAAVWGVVFAMVQPTKEEQDVTALMNQTQHANIWTGRDPVMFPVSNKYIIDNFKAFDYHRSHGWDELQADKVASVEDLVVQAGGYAGHGVVTMGQVNQWQPFGGQTIVMITPLTDKTAGDTATRETIKRVAGESDAVTLLSHSTPESQRSIFSVYCLGTLAPFTQFYLRETVMIKGVPIASGTTRGIDGIETDVTYMLCSSVIRFYDLPVPPPNPKEK